MKRFNPLYQLGEVAGFVLPAVLILMGSLLVLALAALSVSSLERRRARSYVNSLQADLAVSSGLEDVSAMLEKEMSNDEYLVVQSAAESAILPNRGVANYPFIVSMKMDQKAMSYRYVPLFSSGSTPEENHQLEIPISKDLVSSGNSVDFQAHEWQDKLRVQWLPVQNEQGHTVARYAYWLEDLQGKLDPRVAGNSKGSGGNHERVSYPFPAAGVNDQIRSDSEPALNQVGLFALDPEASAKDQGILAKDLIQSRGQMISPESVLAAAGIKPPLIRVDAPHQSGGYVGQLVDPMARALEENLVVGNHSYFEQALVPYVEGIDPSVYGQKKLNLNQLLEADKHAAVDQMSSWIRKALPGFEQRKGGFPDDYIKTLSASALDYADSDGMPRVLDGVYAGFDNYPVLSEIVLHIHLQKAKKINGRWALVWRFQLFGELWNMSDQEISGGKARLSYEVHLAPTPFGSNATTLPLDDPQILNDSSITVKNLTEIDQVFYGPEVDVDLLPDQYRFYRFADVTYTFDYTPTFNEKGEMVPDLFDLEEPQAARGVTLVWNGEPIYRVPRILRDAHGLSDLKTTQSKKTAKACIPGLYYGGEGWEVNNMGDPRIAPYLRTTALGENAYPNNISPGRRNIRRKNIYDDDPSLAKTKHYGRVLPSEWPDGGHNSPVGNFLVTTGDAALPIDGDKWPLAEVPPPEAKNAPQRISNAGRFYSATELGRVYDPVMWQPAYADLDDIPSSGIVDTRVLMGYGIAPALMPTRRNCWPDVTNQSTVSSDYGGGNTLRIGRPEHEKFDRLGQRSSHLLDLFHVGIGNSAEKSERNGELVEIHGQLNINTAGRDALRCLAAGILRQDPGLCKVIDWNHDTSYSLAPKVESLELGAPQTELLADVIADGIIQNRPYASPAELASIRGKDGKSLFGNPQLYDDAGRIQWSDAAAEEVFSRVYDASTVRSRNFRVWVIGQALDGRSDRPRVLAETRKVFSIFVDPGERLSSGKIDPKKQRVRIIYERSF